MTTINGTLEIDHERGVIWFNSQEKCILRICQLPLIPKMAKTKMELLDINFKEKSISWTG